MWRCLCLCVLLLIVASSGCGRAQPLDAPITYTVAVYDPAHDPAVDLAATVAAAKSADKRILLQVGGDWCGWCHRLDKLIAADPAVARALGESFILMKVNKSDENENAEFLAQYPEIPGYPHWFVLDADGKLLHSQGTAELEAGQSYSQSALLQFVDSWKG